MDTKKYCKYGEKKIKELLKDRVDKKRYIHSLNVAERAVWLAEKNGADSEKAYLAGLCHDICKGLSHEEQHELISNAGIDLDEATENSPSLWHSIAGYVYAKDFLKIEDEDILNAIRYHTTGHANMSMLEKVIYMADLTSKERDYPDADYTRNLTDYSLDEGLAYGSTWIIKNLEGKGKNAGKDSYDLYEEYKNVEITYRKD